MRIKLDVSGIRDARGDNKLFPRIRFGLLDRLQLHRLKQIAGGGQDLVLGKLRRDARSIGKNLRVEARVLRIEHVEQRALADLELLAIGANELVIDRGLLVEDTGELATADALVPGGANRL